jgi:hypothetical protein
LAKSFEIQQSQPLHIENTVMMLGKKDLNVNNAFNTYRDMKLDGIISGSVSFIKAILSKGGFELSYHPQATAEEKRLTDALNKSLQNMSDYDIKRLLSNWLSMLDYGCSLNEVVLERVDGRFVFKTISPIHLSTVQKFKFKGGNLTGVTLNPAENDGIIEVQDSAQKEIDGSKLMLFRVEPDADFPLGKSLLYGAYTGWKTKKILQEYEAIGVAKNLSGVLNLKVPSDYITKYFTEPQSDEAIYIGNLIQQAEMLHAGKGSFILTASDTNQNGVRLFEVDTLGGSGGNAQNFNVGAAIGRYNQEILLSLQTVVLSIGQEGGGSFALSDNQTYLLSLFVDNIRAVISYEFKKALRLAYDANGANTDRLPNVKWEEIQPLDWDEFTKGWQRLLQSGGVTPTQELEAFFRTEGNAPQADYSKKLDTTPKADASERGDDAKEG